MSSLPEGSYRSPRGFPSVWLRIFAVAWCLPINPPRPSGFGEEQVDVGHLPKPLPPHGHVKLPTLQLVPVIHLCPLVRVETAAHHTRLVLLSLNAHPEG